VKLIKQVPALEFQGKTEAELPIAMKWLIKKTTKSSSVFLDGTQKVGLGAKENRAITEIVSGNRVLRLQAKYTNKSQKLPAESRKRWLKSGKYAAYELLK
jgi:hypothetical protein